MSLSHVVVSAALLFLGADPSHHHHHHAHGGEARAGHGAGLRFLADRMLFHGAYGEPPGDAVLMGFAEMGGQYEAPTVVLWEAAHAAADPTGHILSTDFPGFWTPVTYGPLVVEVRLSAFAYTAEPVEYVVLLLDGQPLDPHRYAVTPGLPQMRESGLMQTAYRYSLPCPPPGKHILQARYKRDSVWSRLSDPLHFEVRLPEPPQIIAISDSDRHPTPLVAGQMMSITRPWVKIQLSHVNHNASLVAYLDGKPVTAGVAEASCCRTVQLEGHITVGIHTLSVRTVHTQGICSITSEPSNEVVFHYYDENVYLLRPGRDRDNRVYPSWFPRSAADPSKAKAASMQLPALEAPATIFSSPPTAEHDDESPEAGIMLRQAAFQATASVASNRSVRPAFAMVAFQPSGTAAEQLLQSAVERSAAAGASAKSAAKAVNEAAEHARAAAEAAKEADTQRQQAERHRADAEAAMQNKGGDERAAAARASHVRAADHANSARHAAAAAGAEAAGASGAREAAIKARTAAELALGQVRIREKEVQQHVTNANVPAAEAARVQLEAAHSVVGAEANEALKQSELAWQHARSAAAHRERTEAAAAGATAETQRARTAARQAARAAAKKPQPKPRRKQVQDPPTQNLTEQYAVRAEDRAKRAEADADAHLHGVQADGRAARARATRIPPSPFYFAAPAHFPIRGFGPGGEAIDRPGAVIYEDMVFSFDRDGNYTLRFSIQVPDVPTTLHLQLHMQPYANGPWHTITLAPMHFRPEETQDGRTQPSLLQNYVVQGRSEILHRCYGQMGQDGTIRRTGSARFGYGFDAMRRAATY